MKLGEANELNPLLCLQCLCTKHWQCDRTALHPGQHWWGCGVW